MLRSSARFARRRLAAAATIAAYGLVTACASPAPTAAQETGFKLAIGDLGVGIGDVVRLDGLRLNFRDRNLERVRGLNVTLWEPHQGNRGHVRGIALGLPLTGAYDMAGVGVGAGLSVERNFDGVGVGLLGMGAGGRMRGGVLGGLGAGSGDDMEGIALGGLGVGAGGSVRGLAAGGLGVGAGEHLGGIALGGLGVGAGASLTGLAAGGLGVGVGDDARGILLGGLGVGAGGSLTGLAVGGLGAGVGGDANGVLIGGVGVGVGRTMRGAALAGVGVGLVEGRGLVVAPAYFRVEGTGSFHGVSVSAFNDIRGTQRGLAIGLVNIANELHGLQVGLINIARNKESFSVLPLFNYSP